MDAARRGDGVRRDGDGVSLPDDYIAALERLAFAFTSYHQRTDETAV